MKVLFLLLLSAPSFAQTADDSKLMAAIKQIGVVGITGRGLVAMQQLSSFDPKTGDDVTKLSVFFEPTMGPYVYTISDISLYEAKQESSLVVTYLSKSEDNEIITVSKIFEVNSDALKTIAAVVKANSTAKETDFSSESFPIFVYQLNSISCSVPFSFPKPKCEIKK